MESLTLPALKKKLVWGGVLLIAVGSGLWFFLSPQSEQVEGWTSINKEISGLLEPTPAVSSSSTQLGSGTGVHTTPETSAAASGASPAAATHKPNPQTVQVININTGSLSRLMELPRIGESKGKAIIAYREANGPFRRKEDITKVKGIGPKTFELLQDRISVEEGLE